jgi:hypothetical protein
MAFQDVQQVRATFDLNCREMLFLLACIEIADAHAPASPENKALYKRLVQEYVGIVSDGVAPHETLYGTG